MKIETLKLFLKLRDPYCVHYDEDSMKEQFHKLRHVIVSAIFILHLSLSRIHRQTTVDREPGGNYLDQFCVSMLKFVEQEKVPILSKNRMM